MQSFKDFLQEEYIQDIQESILEFSSEEMEIFLEYCENNSDEALQDISEAISRITRRKRSNTMKRIQKKLQRGKEIQQNKSINNDNIRQRAREMAIQILKRKFSGGKLHLSVSDKERIEARISKINDRVIQKIADKQFKIIKKYETERRINSKNNERTEGAK